MPNNIRKNMRNPNFRRNENNNKNYKENVKGYLEDLKGTFVRAKKEEISQVVVEKKICENSPNKMK